MVLPLTALFTAMGLEFLSWGQGRFNWGPRTGAVLLLVFGQVAFTGNVVGQWLRQGVDWAAHWLGVGAAYLLGGTAGDAIAYLVHWLPAAILGAYWIAAMLGGIGPIKERMTWRLAWAGLFLPVFVSAIPGPAGDFLTTVVNAAAGAGAGFIGWLFSLRG